MHFLHFIFVDYTKTRTMDGYRDTLFEKLNLKTRVGLVMYAIKNGIVQI